jgi:hypothetical protein
MLSTDQPLELGLPELPYGSVWLIEAGTVIGRISRRWPCMR